MSLLTYFFQYFAFFCFLPSFIQFTFLFLLYFYAFFFPQIKSEWPFWNAQQHLDSVPGLEAEYDRLADNLHAFVPFPVQEALESIDLQKDIIDKLDAGKIPEIDIATYDILPAESPVRIAIEKEYDAFAKRISAAGATVTPLATMLSQARAAHAAANPTA